MASKDEAVGQTVLDLEKEIEALDKREPTPETEKRRGELLEEFERRLEEASNWDRTLLARHPKRPYTLEFVSHMIEEFVELHGDRRFADDPAIVTGFGTLRGRPVAVIGHQKGRDTKEKLRRNFGMARPEGYRKALRIMQMAEKFGRPVLTFIDTPGAYPGIGAEQRGQAEAIAFNLREMARLKTPIVATVTGEGGSGGALALAVADYVNILGNSIYSVITPEGCAAILWRDQSKAPEAAAALKLTAPELLEQNVVDRVIDEPRGGAHRDPEAMAATLEKVIFEQLTELSALPMDDLLERRYQKFRAMGRILMETV